jgi:hypothetical protein
MSSTVNARRECGQCTACCRVMIVPELSKPANIKCQYADNGCKMYDHRPPTCREWNCLWVQGKFSNSQRPDKVKFVSWVLPASQSKQWDHPVVAMRELKEGSTCVPAGESAISKLNKEKATVLVIKKDTGRVIYPAKGFKAKIKMGLDSQGVEYRELGGRFYLSREYCEKVWPIDYATERNLKEELVKINEPKSS